MPFDSGYYAVGYGKPPVETRFKKGQSGNPSGRPKAKPETTTLGDEVEKVLNERLAYTENNRPRISTKREVLARQIVNGALKGNMKFIELVEQFSPAAQDVADSPASKPDAGSESEFEVTTDVLRVMAQINRQLAASVTEHLNASNAPDKKTAQPQTPEPTPG